MFPDAYVVHATFESTADALAEANGPYVVPEGAECSFVGGPAKPDTDYAWEFGDGAWAAEMQPRPTYGDDGLYVAMLKTTVNQQGGVVTRHFAAVRARNVPPVVDAGRRSPSTKGRRSNSRRRSRTPEWPDTHRRLLLRRRLAPGRRRGQRDQRPAARGRAPPGLGTPTATTGSTPSRSGSETTTAAWGRIRTVVVRNVPPTVDAGADLCACPARRSRWWRASATRVGAIPTPAPGTSATATPVRTAIVRERHDPPAGIGIAAATHVYE